MSTLTSAVQLGTTDTPHAAGRPAQRAVTRAPDGTLWAVFPDAAGGHLQCLGSSDGGATWFPAAQNETLWPVHDASLTIDEEGYADLVYGGEGPRYLYYRKGTPKEGGWDWSIRVRIFDVPELASVNAVAHAEAEEWKIHVVWSRGGEFASAYYNSFKIDPLREIWLGTRERIAGQFDQPGHPAPSIDMNRESKQLWAAMWGGSLGVIATEATYHSGRWFWSRPRPLDGSAGAHEGSVSAAWAGDALAVSYGAGDELCCGDARAAGPAALTSCGVDAGGTVHVFYRSAEPGPLYHRRVAAAGLSEAEQVHPGPVQSFSCEQHGGDGIGVVLAAGEAAPYSVEFLHVD